MVPAPVPAVQIAPPLFHGVVPCALADVLLGIRGHGVVPGVAGVAPVSGHQSQVVLVAIGLLAVGLRVGEAGWATPPRSNDLLVPLPQAMVAVLRGPRHHQGPDGWVFSLCHRSRSALSGRHHQWACQQQEEDARAAAGHGGLHIPILWLPGHDTWQHPLRLAVQRGVQGGLVPVSNSVVLGAHTVSSMGPVW